MPSGIIGFPDDKRYVLLEHKKGSSFLWFQSVDNGSLAFVLIDPFLFKPDYEIQLNPEDIVGLGLENGSEGIEGVQPLVIVNILKTEPRKMTANLLGPIVLNLRKKLARQVILHHQRYSHRFPIPQVKEEKDP
jgi:flagellar assembly factor FliW